MLGMDHARSHPPQAGDRRTRIEECADLVRMNDIRLQRPKQVSHPTDRGQLDPAGVVETEQSPSQALDLRGEHPRLRHADNRDLLSHLALTHLVDHVPLEPADIQ